MQDLRLLQLVPLGAAILEVIGTEPRGQLAPALDVRKEWVTPEIWHYYEIWQSFRRDEDRAEWVFANYQVDPLVIQAIQQVGDGVAPRDAVNTLKERWFRNTELDLQRKLVDAPVADKPKILNELQALYGQTEGHAYEVNMEQPPSPNEPLLMREGVGLLYRCEITAVKAKAKSGKTHLGQIWAAAMIANGPVMGFSRKEGAQPHRVLFVDTEQSKHGSWRIARNVQHLAGLDTSKNTSLLKVINLRSMETKERLAHLRGIVSTGAFDCVILDGIKDLVQDINNNIESDHIANLLTILCESYNLSLLTVLHENPAKDDDKMRGHLGTELTNKAHDVFEVARDPKNEVFNVSTSESREKPAPKWAFHFDDDNEIEECEPTEKETAKTSPQPPTKEEKDQRNWRMVMRAFEDNPNVSLTQADMIKALAKKVKWSRSKSQRYIEYFLNIDKLKKEGSGQGARIYVSPQALTEYNVEQANIQACIEQNKMLDSVPDEDVPF